MPGLQRRTARCAAFPLPVVVQIERAAGTEQYAIRLGGTSDAVYLACRSNSEQLNTAEDTGTSLSRWVISMEDGHMTIRSARYLSRTLQYDADAGCFRCYAKTKTPLTVYRGETSSLWYTTQPKMHDHQLVETAVASRLAPCRAGSTSAARSAANCAASRWSRWATRS